MCFVLNSDRGPLPQARYLDAVRQHGRDPKLIAKAMGNRTIGACKKFWSKARRQHPSNLALAMMCAKPWSVSKLLPHIDSSSTEQLRSRGPRGPR